MFNLSFGTPVGRARKLEVARRRRQVRRPLDATLNMPVFKLDAAPSRPYLWNGAVTGLAVVAAGGLASAVWLVWANVEPVLTQLPF